MIATLAWKEYREHRPVCVALAVLAAVLIVIAAQFLPPAGTIPPDSDKQVGISGLAIMLAVVYGLLCGSMLLAGERELGTLPFLDVLTARRSRVWTTKLLVGAALTTAQATFSESTLSIAAASLSGQSAR